MKNLFEVKYYLFFLILIASGQLFAQGEFDTEQKKLVFKNENTFSGILSSNGFGANYRFGKRMDGYRKRIFDIDLFYVRHPKEIKTQSQYYTNNSNPKRYVFGKLNNFFSFQLGTGRQKEVYSRFDKGGIVITNFYSFGFAGGLLKPIYYEILYPTEVKGEYLVVTEKFNTNVHMVADIYGKAPFLTGIDETKLIPGLFFKYGFNFEYSSSDVFIRAIETGFSVQGYLKEIPIMATEENNQFFVSVFVAYRFGKAYSRRLKKENTDN